MITSLGLMNVLIVGGLTDACFLGYLTIALIILKMIIATTPNLTQESQETYQ